MPFDQFPANRPNEPRSPIDVAVRPLPRSPVSSSLDNVVPQSIVRSPRVRPGEFVFSHAKRLLQQNPPRTDMERPPSSPKEKPPESGCKRNGRTAVQRGIVPNKAKQ